MEFFYDEQAVANEEPSPEKQDEKTEQVFHKLEDEVNRQYERTTSVLKNIVKEDEDGLKLNLALDPEVSETAQRYLHQLDSNLQTVENFALNYWTKVSDAGFWPSMAGKLESNFERIVKINDSGANNQPAPGAAGGNRTEAELRALSSNKAIYLNHPPSPSNDFDADAKTNEIAKILEQDTDIAHLMNEIVPQNISYKDFWNIYFGERKRILEMEEKRKKILARKEAPEDEEFGWDDDGEGDEEEPVIIKKEDTLYDGTANGKPEDTKVNDGTTGESNNVKKEGQYEGEREDENDDEDEDDWE